MSTLIHSAATSKKIDALQTSKHTYKDLKRLLLAILNSDSVVVLGVEVVVGGSGGALH